MARSKKAVRHPSRAKAHVQVATVNLPDVSGLKACVEEARAAALDADRGPEEPHGYKQLCERLERFGDLLPPLYQKAFFVPFGKELDKLGEKGFERLLARDPDREGAAGLMLDIAQAILQRGDKYAAIATEAFQEVVSDIYDGFLSEEDRRGVKPPDECVIAPLVKWGNPDFGPYTWPATAASSFGLETGVVSLPPANARSGIVAWSAIAHETAGHDILSADHGLADELADQVHRQLKSLGSGLSDYWASRIDETASDVMGILNIGPAAAIGLIAYFRALNLAYSGTAVLRSDGSADDPHPADVARGYLAAETTALLEFTGKTKWAKVVAAETDKDAGTIVLGRAPVSVKLARKSAQIVAKTLVTYKAITLEGHALGEIQNWRDADERVVKRLRQSLRAETSVNESILADTYAAHAVAAAVMEALSGGSNPPLVFERMLNLLKAMHDTNPCWGPLYVKHPGDMVRRIFYHRERAAD